MRRFEIDIQENDIPDNTQSVGEDSKFICIAEMSVDIHLFRIRAGGSL